MNLPTKIVLVITASVLSPIALRTIYFGLRYIYVRSASWIIYHDMKWEEKRNDPFNRYPTNYER